MLTLLLTLALAKRPTLPVFPMTPGTVWTYRGDVEWTEETTPKKATITWEMQVIEVTKSATATTAILRGLPSDLADYEPGFKPRYTIFTETATGIYCSYVDPDATLEDARKTAQTPATEPLVRLPITLGDCVDEDDKLRKEAMYCWSVEDKVTDPRGAGWMLVYRSNPSHAIMTLVPGTGITSYEYKHHGTVATVNVTLISISH